MREKSMLKLEIIKAGIGGLLSVGLGYLKHPFFFSISSTSVLSISKRKGMLESA